MNGRLASRQTMVRLFAERDRLSSPGFRGDDFTSGRKSLPPQFMHLHNLIHSHCQYWYHLQTSLASCVSHNLFRCQALHVRLSILVLALALALALACSGHIRKLRVRALFGTTGPNVVRRLDTLHLSRR